MILSTNLIAAGPVRRAEAVGRKEEVVVAIEQRAIQIERELGVARDESGHRIDRRRIGRQRGHHLGIRRDL